MMWRYPAGDEAGRESWWIVLPMDHPDIGTPGHPSEVSWRTTDRDSQEARMWDVSGTPPRITVNPSIDVLRYVMGPPDPSTGLPTWVREGSYWHGWIRDGVLVSA